MPLVINYRSPSEYIPYRHSIHRRRDLNLEDEYAHSGILHALQQYDPTRFIALKVQSKTLQKLIVPMDRHFPRLATLSLLSESQTIPKKDTTLILPRGFLAPNLRHLELCRIFLPTGLPFLTSTPFLVVLKLTNIQASGYFSPEDLVTQLGHLLQLEDLSIDFSISLPDPDEEEELLRVPMTPTRLPSLRLLEFRGVCAYLEGLVGRISAPWLERFHITLFYEPTFTLGHLSEFIEATEGIRCPCVMVAFGNPNMASSFSVTSRNELPIPDSPLALNFQCNQFDWQVYSMTEVCEALVPVLSVSELSLQYPDPGTLRYPSFGEPHRSSDGQNALDSVMWHELLRPFNGVRRLGVSNHLAEELSCTLDADDAGLIPWLLPELQELALNDFYPHVEATFAAFLNARQSVGRPVNLLPPPVPWVPPIVDEVFIPSELSYSENEAQ